MMDVPFLGSIPIDPLFSEAADAGVPAVQLHPESLTARAFVQIAGALARSLPAKQVAEAPPEVSKPCPGSGHHHHGDGHGHHEHEAHGAEDAPQQHHHHHHQKQHHHP
jgi:hypothetical protein